MFEWYRSAAVCFAYLVDVPDAKANHHHPASPFRKSRWFTRGWTLQELLAPATVVFYDHSWEKIGTKSSLSDVISDITGIRRSHMIEFQDVNVAVKMSWASERKTTRTEDIAYCLMGLFNIQMPLLYGEGKNAFLRLQLEIIKMSDDETIFAWDGWEDVRESGLLALSPSTFRDCGNIRQTLFDRERPVYSMTNKGLRMELLLWRRIELEHPKINDMKVFLAPLNCTRHQEGHPIAIYLQTSMHNESGHFTRCFLGDPRTTNFKNTYLELKHKEAGRKIVYVKQLDIDLVRLVHVSERSYLKIRYPLLHCELREVRHFFFEDDGGYNVRLTDEEELLDKVSGKAILIKFFPNNGYGVMLHTIGNNLSGNFVVLAYRSRAGYETNIVATDGTKTLTDIVSSFKEQAMYQEYRSDRTSIHLGGGSSVSAALRPVGSQENSSDGKFVLDITINPAAGSGPGYRGGRDGG
jgi:hypothetical protein